MPRFKLENIIHLADKIRHLFIEDDGSLPDIFIHNLSETDVRKTYLKAISLGLKDDQILAWDTGADKEKKYTNSNYLDGLFSGKVESSRIGLPDLVIDGVIVPISTIAVYSDDQIEFDYRMGSDWNDKTLIALLEFIALLRDEVLHLKVKRADEWLALKALRFKNDNLILENYKTSSDGIFSQTFNEYYAQTRFNKN